jgi:hypothetical protein
MDQRGLQGSRCFINARTTRINTPSALAAALVASAIPKLAQQLFPSEMGLQSAKAVAGVLGELQGKQTSADGSEFTFTGKVFAPILNTLKGDTQEAPPLATACRAYIALLDAWDKAKADGRVQNDTPPVLVLDEANVLSAWGDEDKAEREALLKFFVAITKEQQRNHVILSTSDYSFQAWLSQGKAAARIHQYTTSSTSSPLSF